MDLSKVTLPTFILEPRSFLDKLADYYYHANYLGRLVSYTNFVFVVFSTLGDLVSIVRDILSIEGDIFSTGGGGFIVSTMRVILRTLGNILSSMVGVQYQEGYHDSCAKISPVPWGIFKFPTFFMFSTSDIMIHIL